MISEELAQLKQDIKQTQADIRRFERDLAWNRVIDKAIVVCRLLGKLEMAEAHKFNPNWHLQPRRPRGNNGAGQWTDEGGSNVHLVGDSESPDKGRPPNQYLTPYVEPTTPVLVGEATLSKFGSSQQLHSAAKDGDVLVVSAVTPGTGQSGPRGARLPGLPAGAGYYIWTWSDNRTPFKSPPDVRVGSGTLLVGTFAKPTNNEVTISGLNSYYGRVLRFSFAPDDTTPPNTTIRVYKMPKAKR